MLGSRYINQEDMARIDFGTIADFIYKFYEGGQIHTFGAKCPETVRMHWSREWEYPYCIIASGVKRGDIVLDLGSGGSPLPPYLASMGCDVTVFDREDITKGQRSLRSYGIDPKGYGLKFIQKNMGHKIPFPDNFFDIIYCISVVEELPFLNLFSFLYQVRKLLKGKGSFILTMDLYEGDREKKYRTKEKFDFLRHNNILLVGEFTNNITSIEDLPGNYQVVGLCMIKP
jgi:ubiquinone/menaquinone biosynthesis C-methylase UbiE